METIWKRKDDDSRRTVVDRLDKLEDKVAISNAKDVANKEQKKFTWKGKFGSMFKKDPDKIKDKIIVILLNSKREIETPEIVPVVSGKIIVYRDKGYQFDPACLYTIKQGNKINRVLLLEEDDRLPIGHRYRQLKFHDVEDLKAQGRFTGNDPILLKMLWNAQLEKKPIAKVSGKVVLWIVLGIIAVIVVYMFAKG